MIKSMTAFAANNIVRDALAINCELRSVNHRYCDITIKLPEKLRFIEADLRSIISSKIKRGKIECALAYQKSLNKESTLTVNMAAVKHVLEATQRIEGQMESSQPLSALEILNYPGILHEPEIEKETLTSTVIELVEQALTTMINVREREGQQLAVLLEDRCIKMQTYVVTARKRMPEVLKNLRNKISNRLEELIVEPDFDRLEQEMVLLTQKLDVAEELDRLETHISEVLRVLKQNEPIGRRLDFLMQEMNREANTLGSKSADKETTQISIELKVLIEQMREQVQNIE
jgi:uncharacterized protein (TIGR00255 family)